LAAVLIEYGAHHAISHVFTADRHRLVNANPDRGISDGELEAVDRVSLKGLLAWPLPGSRVSLGDATRPQLAESLRYCRGISQTYDVNARFLGFLFGLAKDERLPIKRQLTPEQVRSCRERAEKAVA
jgi:hypothetical protein